MHLIRCAALLLAYMAVFAFAVLMLASFEARDYEAGSLCLALTALALAAVLKGEGALEAQALRKFYRELVD